MSFPSNFVWGAATASYQIEGAVSEDGRSPSVWDAFSARPGKVFNGDTGAVACDHYHRYEEDIALMKEMGLKHYRLSIAWPRILPEGTGAVNQKGLAFYSRLIDCLLAAGITPWVTLFHWDLPLCLQRAGGWLNPATADAFAEFTRVVATALGDRVVNWMTFNEPQCFIVLGHHVGVHAPGVHYDDPDFAVATHTMLVAHGKAVSELRKIGGDRFRIGYVPTTRGFIPATESPADIEVCRELMFGFRPPAGAMWTFAAFTDPVFLGRYPDDYFARFGAYLPAGWELDMPSISQKIDFCGINVYSGDHFAAGENGAPKHLPAPAGFPTSALKWNVEPESLRWVPRFLWERYRVPVIITENGLSMPDWVSLDGKVHDPGRIDYTWRYLLELEKAISDGADVAGYFHWSLMDNFEWAEGYKERFGLIHVDFQTQKRTIKDSGYWYREVMESNGVSLHRHE